MKKFVIECPSCGRYAEASTGFFARKKIDCACGYVINVKTDKLSSKECPHCGNTVVYDQSKGEEAKCPVCHELINTRDSMKNIAEFTCPSCSCKLSADKNARSYTCPLCDTVIDVQERIAKEEIKNQGLASVIKYEGGNDTFVWKHPIEDFNLGSQLIVHESQEAIFFRDGQALDLFGAGRYTLATHNIPLLENLYKLPANTDEVFHSEVYFINLTTQMGIKWGTDSKVRLFDPASGLHIEIGACGNFSLRVSESRKLLVKLVGTASEFKQNEVVGDPYSVTSVVGKFKALVMNKVKSNIARIIKENNINILEVDEYIDVISEKLRVAINETLGEYGLTMPEFFVTSVLTPDDDPNFRRLKQQFAEKTLRVREEEVRRAEAEAAQSRKILEAQTEAQLKLVGAQGDAEALKIKAQAEADAYKAQAFAEAAEMQAKGYTYQQETARMVGMEAMQNGITGNGEGGGGGSALGDLAGLGVTLGAMGSVIGMTKDALNPIMQNATDIGSGVMEATDDGWNCACGCKNIKSKFCPDCGTKKPEPKLGWDCACGCKNITSNFCPDCGTKRPEVSAVWNCTCGCKGITSKFCPDCGAKKPEVPTTWDCPDCGNKDINAKFCPECGHKREG
ncbi:MAG: SPFH domain-containing protein [Clostridia bacterium]|nr:SPFH domain-containing protein [Clostridia bacterium]